MPTWNQERVKHAMKIYRMQESWAVCLYQDTVLISGSPSIIGHLPTSLHNSF